MKNHRAYRRSLRVAMSAALLGAMLSGCSSVPDAVNPVKWYAKTTDFFSGDNQAAETPTTATGENKGLAADPNAPAPAPAPQVSNAPSGLNADQVAGNYASPPIERQGAPSDVLRAEPPAQSVASDAPPVPMAQPVMPVTAAPMAPPAAMANANAPTPGARTPGVLGTLPANLSPTPERPASMSMADAPPPLEFNAPADAMAPFGRDEFETVVISSDGMDTMAQPSPSFGALQQPMASSGAMFPTPGATTSDAVSGVSAAGVTRVATINFANNSSLLDARDRSILGAVIQLQRERGGHVVVVGHASSRTADMDYIAHQMANFEISMQRATTVGNVLRDMGLESETLEVQAVSDTTPLYQEVMPSGEAGNRRVEIYLSL